MDANISSWSMGCLEMKGHSQALGVDLSQVHFLTIPGTHYVALQKSQRVGLAFGLLYRPIHIRRTILSPCWEHIPKNTMNIINYT